jgi:hypothetical protein
MGSGPLPEGFGMALNEDFSRVSAFIIGDAKDDAGEKIIRRAIGTAFLMVVRNEDYPEQRHAYLVTAAHLITSQPSPEVRIRTVQGQVLEDQPLNHWVFHDTEDIAVAPIWFSPELNVVFNPYELEQAVDRASKQPRVGDTVYFIGLLAGILEMERTAIPMVRSGTIAALNQPGIPLTNDVHTTAHLIDCRSFNGFSGSPCYVQWPTYYYVEDRFEPGDKGLMYNEETRLFGMLIAHLDDYEKQQGRQTIRLNIGVGIVLPIERVRDVLESDELVALRREQLERPQERVATLSGLDDTDNDLAKGAFESALHRATRFTAPPESGQASQ